MKNINKDWLVNREHCYLFSAQPLGVEPDLTADMHYDHS